MKVWKRFYFNCSLITDMNGSNMSKCTFPAAFFFPARVYLHRLATTLNESYVGSCVEPLCSGNTLFGFFWCPSCGFWAVFVAWDGVMSCCGSLLLFTHRNCQTQRSLRVGSRRSFFFYFLSFFFFYWRLANELVHYRHQLAWSLDQNVT